MYALTEYFLIDVAVFETVILFLINEKNVSTPWTRLFRKYI